MMIAQKDQELEMKNNELKSKDEKIKELTEKIDLLEESAREERKSTEDWKKRCEDWHPIIEKEMRTSDELDRELKRRDKLTRRQEERITELEKLLDITIYTSRYFAIGKALDHRNRHSAPEDVTRIIGEPRWIETRTAIEEMKEYVLDKLVQHGLEDDADSYDDYSAITSETEVPDSPWEGDEDDEDSEYEPLD